MVACQACIVRLKRGGDACGAEARMCSKSQAAHRSLLPQQNVQGGIGISVHIGLHDLVQAV